MDNSLTKNAPQAYEKGIELLLRRDTYSSYETSLSPDDVIRLNEFFEVLEQSRDGEGGQDPIEKAQPLLDAELKKRNSTVLAVGEIALFSATKDGGSETTLGAVGLVKILDDVNEILSGLEDNAYIEPIRRGFIGRRLLGEYDRVEPHTVSQRKARMRRELLGNLFTLLSRVSENPEQEVISRLYGQHLIEATRLASQERRNGGITQSQPKRVGTTRADRMSRYDEEAQSSLEEKTQEIGEEDTEDTPPVVTKENGETSITTEKLKKEMTLDDETREVDVTEYMNGEVGISLFKFMTRKVQKIANSLDRGRKNQDGLDRYENEIHKAAMRMAGGIMPWESSNSVKRATGSDSEVEVWYTFDISPNAPRVYFRVSEEKIVDGKPHRDVIVVAETDKQHQLRVLSALTGKSQKTLKAEGAGSV